MKLPSVFPLIILLTVIIEVNLQSVQKKDIEEVISSKSHVHKKRYKPVLIIHGVMSGNKTLESFKERIQREHGTTHGHRPEKYGKSIHSHKQEKGNAVDANHGHTKDHGRDKHVSYSQNEANGQRQKEDSLKHGHKQEQHQAVNSKHDHKQEHNSKHDHKQEQHHDVNSKHDHKQEKAEFRKPSPYELLLAEAEEEDPNREKELGEESDSTEEQEKSNDSDTKEDQENADYSESTEEYSNGDSDSAEYKKDVRFSWKDHNSTEDDSEYTDLLNQWNDTHKIEDELTTYNPYKEFIDGLPTFEPDENHDDEIMKGHTFVVDGYNKSLEFEDDIFKVVYAIGRELKIMNPLEGVKNAERIWLDLPSREPPPIVIQFYNKETKDIWNRQFDKRLVKGVLDPNAFDPHTGTPFYPESFYPKTTPWYIINETTTPYIINPNIDFNSTHVRVPPYPYKERPLHYYITTDLPSNSTEKKSFSLCNLLSENDRKRAKGVKKIDEQRTKDEGKLPDFLLDSIEIGEDTPNDGENFYL